MPTYCYETIPTDPSVPPRRFEVEQRMSAPPLTQAPDTGEPVRRVVLGGLGFLNLSDKTRPDTACGGDCGRPGSGNAGCACAQGGCCLH